MSQAPTPVELNVDAGELPDEPEELFALATTVNLACGGHAGDAASMQRAVARAVSHGAQVVAHPSYADRAGFGRRARFCGAEQVAADVERQCGALRAVAREAGVAVRGVKPHGALYHDAAADPALATALVSGARRALPELERLVGPASGALKDAAEAAGLRYWAEGFVDRRYDAGGQLVPRDQPGALLTDPLACAAQAVALARSARYRTLCAHGDTPGAVEIARSVALALSGAGLLAAR